MGFLAQATPELGPITWGAFYWCSTAMGHHLAFKHAPQDPIFLITQGTWAHTESFPQQLTETNAGALARHPI